MIKTFPIILSLLILMGCKNNDQVYTLPITVDDNNRIYVPMVFEGDTIPFLFDTCASGTSAVKCQQENYAKGRPITVEHIYQTPFENTIEYDDGFFKLSEVKLYDNFTIGNKYLLGQNIISQFYWYFDLKNNIVQFSKSPIKNLPSSELELSYFIDKDWLNIPYVNVRTNANNKFKMLFDTGCAGDYSIQIFKETINRDSIHNIWRSSASDLFLGYQVKTLIDMWLADSVYIDNKHVDNFIISNNISDDFAIKRMDRWGSDGLITAGFVNRYNGFYIDPKNKKFLFFEEKSTNKEKMLVGSLKDVMTQVKQDSTKKVFTTVFR